MLVFCHDTSQSDLPPELTHSGVRAADRLGFTLFGGADSPGRDPRRGVHHEVEPKQISKTLEITLSTFKSEKKPEKADFLAQDNQQGSGTLDKKAVPKTTEVAPFPGQQVNKVTPPPAAKPEVKQAAPKAAVDHRGAKSPESPDPARSRQDRAAPKQTRIPTFDSSQLSSEISSLEAELANEQQLYAKRPRIYR
jgi:periplasmic protein TonB